MEDRQDETIDDLLERATEALRRSPVPQGPAPDAVARVMEAVAAAELVPLSAKERVGRMKHIIKIAAAATILAALGTIVSWIMVRGGSTNVAFAAVAEALDHLRSATFDVTTEMKGDHGQPPVNATGKGFFLAPSRQRMETSVEVPAASGKKKMTSIMIIDNQAAKSIMLMPDEKSAMAMDMEKMKETTKKSGKGPPPDLFETVRRLVREGSTGPGEKAERLGKKEIDGHPAVGFRTHDNMSDMTLWADPATARPVRVELTAEMFADVRVVMNNFRYDVALDPSLFSLEPPAGYSSQTVDFTLPVEEDLIRTLRTLAEHSKGVFPTKLGMSKEVMEPLMEVVKPEMEKLEAKYRVKPKPGERPPAAMMAEAMKTLMPVIQKQMQGITFYMTLKPENDSHYTGGGVKLGTPERPIFWYRPTGAEKYRVIYADLSVKKMNADEAKKLPGTAPAGKR